MSNKVRNTYKFKMKTIGLDSNHSEGYVEFLGHPSALDFKIWADNLKEPVEKITIENISIATWQTTGKDPAASTVNRIRWKKNNGEGIKFDLTVSI